MKVILRFIFLISLIGISANSYAQIKERVKERAKESSTNKAERTVDQSIEEVADEMINGVKSLFKKKPKKEKQAPVEKQDGSDYGSWEVSQDQDFESNQDSGEFETQEKKSLSRYSNFSFVQGEEIIAFDDFLQDKEGDLPGSWITTGSAEVVSFDEVEGHWVWFNKTKGNFIPEYLKDFPENFTLEFDLMYDFEFGTYSHSRTLTLVLSDIENPEANLGWDGDGEYFNLQKLSNNYLGIEFLGTSSNGGPFITGRKVVHTEKGLNFQNKFLAKHLINEEGINEPIHISISRMGRRVQVFANEEKVLDLTAAFQKDVKLTSARFFVYNHTDNDNYYLSNIRYAVGQPDTRSKLLESGSYTTSAITFASGSPDINPESYGILKEIAQALKAQANKTVQIIGHTDSDGAEELNQRLSEQRAMAVKEALQNEFGVQNEINSIGKGESSPVAENNTPTGKAKNRRVEFILN
ncbi:OmpA family protein [Belliella kenyensis]|uniref:OmpA family protein n=1 Tax=Belliella kenyensis TaxID=1472724 RepID=A0ABV8EPH8_9BACT|nr:OmpA family protein [Belliella kenyensis]MCH7400740.1 OmpA family protein [Belliella kenyensis]MDN3601973.1 OmpA family protein [Belliella kenyensis]